MSLSPSWKIVKQPEEVCLIYLQYSWRLKFSVACTRCINAIVHQEVRLQVKFDSAERLLSETEYIWSRLSAPFL